MIRWSPWGPKLDRLQQTVEQVRDSVASLQRDDALLDLIRQEQERARAEQEDILRRLAFLATQAGVMDPDGIKEDEA